MHNIIPVYYRTPQGGYLKYTAISFFRERNTIVINHDEGKSKLYIFFFFVVPRPTCDHTVILTVT